MRNQRVDSDGLTGAGLRAFRSRTRQPRDSPEEADAIADEVALLAGGTVITAATAPSEPLEEPT